MSVLVPLVVLALPVLDTAGGDRPPRHRAESASPRPIAGHFHHQCDLSLRSQRADQAVLLIYAVCLVLGAVALAFSGTFTHVFRHAV